MQFTWCLSQRQNLSKVSVAPAWTETLMRAL
jgi:hypothetical protein